MGDPSVNFILSKERSGSTLLSTMLNMNDQCISFNEEPFILFLKKKYESNIDWTKEGIQNLLDDLYIIHEQELNLQFSEKEESFSYLVQQEKPKDYIELVTLIAHLFSPHKNSRDINVIVDKELKYLIYFNHLVKSFPKSKFIVITREPKDNIVVCQKRNLGKSKNVVSQAERWNRNYDKVLKKHLQNSSIYILKYEDLVLSPKVTLNKICTFLGLIYNENMLTYPAKNSEVIEASNTLTKEKKRFVKDFHEGLFTAPDKNKIGVWKNNLSTKEAKIINYITYKNQKKLGYDVQLSDCEKPFFISTVYFRILSYYDLDFKLKLYIHTPFSIKRLFKRLSRTK